MKEKSSKISLKTIFILGLAFLILLSPLLSFETKGQDLEDGYYVIPLKLWHALEERPSMGNGAIVQEGEIEVQDGKMMLYIGAEKMEVMSITASLVNLYYQDENGDYRPAERGAFEIEIPGEHQKRPMVLRYPIGEVKEYLNVMVDPKVEPMGDAPIKARIKLDPSALRKISLEESNLIEKFKNGSPKPAFDPNTPGSRSDKTMVLEYPAGAFDQDFTFYANKLVGDQEKTYSQDFGALARVEFYKFECLGPLDIIKDGQDDIQGTREKYQPKKPVKITIPLNAITAEDNPKLYRKDDGGWKEMTYEIIDGNMVFETESLGDFVIEASEDQPTTTKNTQTSSQLPTSKSKPNQSKPRTNNPSRSQPRANMSTKSVSSKTNNPAKTVAQNTKPAQASPVKTNSQTNTTTQENPTKQAGNNPGSNNGASLPGTNSSNFPGASLAATNNPGQNMANQGQNIEGQEDLYQEGQIMDGQTLIPRERPGIIVLGIAIMAVIIIVSIYFIRENGQYILELKEEESYLEAHRKTDEDEEE